MWTIKPSFHLFFPPQKELSPGENQQEVAKSVNDALISGEFSFLFLLLRYRVTRCCLSAVVVVVVGAVAAVDTVVHLTPVAVP